MSTLTISDHARRQADRCGLDEQTIREVACHPEQIISVRTGREIRQSPIMFGPSGGVYLVRVVVDIHTTEDTVVTVYRTSHTQRYWREE